MKQTSHQFNENVTRALAEPTLKVALDRTTTLLRSRRAKVIDAFPQYEKARETAQKIKDHTLDNLEYYLCFAFWRLAAIVEGAWQLYVAGEVDSDYARGLEQTVPALLAEAQAAASGDW